jgi:hypothetical protein
VVYWKYVIYRKDEKRIPEMRKKPGYHELSFYLTDEQFELLERYWRFQTREQYITNAAAVLLVEVLQERVQSKPPPQQEKPGEIPS